MEWRSTGDYGSVAEIITNKSGMTVSELLHPEKVNPHFIYNLEKAAYVINTAIERNRPITVVGDYDADGLTATAILVKLLNYLGSDPVPVIPRRLTDGYGITKEMVVNASVGLIITVDNGITCVDQIRHARELGNDVIILDHHLPGDILPEATVIVDPHVYPTERGYTNYCGAGLAFKLAEMLLESNEWPDKTKLLRELNVLACVGTIADIVPLTGDNRRIVMDGLKIIKVAAIELSSGLRTLLASAGDEVTSESIAYKIAPLINAPGRLYNSGGTSLLKALLCNDASTSMFYIEKLLEINKSRKELSAEAFKKAVEAICKEDLEQDEILCILDEEIPEGLIGIVAGQLAQEYKRPAFVFTFNENDNTLRGSGRSHNGFDLKGLLDYVHPLTIKAGGHSRAAGITLERKNYDSFVLSLKSYSEANRLTLRAEQYITYDMEIEPSQIGTVVEELKRFAPFGEGVPEPVFAVRNFEPVVNMGSHYKMMGSNHEHIRLSGDGFSAVAFNIAEKYIEMNCPQRLNLLGTIGENVFNGRTTIQLLVSDFKEV